TFPADHTTPAPVPPLATARTGTTALNADEPLTAAASGSHTHQDQSDLVWGRTPHRQDRTAPTTPVPMPPQPAGRRTPINAPHDATSPGTREETHQRSETEQQLTRISHPHYRHRRPPSEPAPPHR